VPQAEAIVIPGARHLAQLTHAEQVNEALERFFSYCDSQLSGRIKAAEEVE